MRITINENDINDYLNGKFNDIRKIIWPAGELNKSVINNFPNLRELNCNYNQITSLEPLSNCVNLQILHFSGNQITSLESLSYCINLLELKCSSNQITTLEPLSDCIHLRNLCCHSNQITSLEPLSNCIYLQELDCRKNPITSLEPLSICVHLQRLYCSENQLTSLEPLSNCANIQKLYCWSNQITSLEPLSNCINLQELDCSDNQLTSLAPLVYLRQLFYIDHHGNPLEVQTVQVQRFLNRIQTNQNSSIYNDSQNVHNTEIQRCVCDSLRSLLLDPKSDFSINNIIDSNLNAITKEALIEYCQDQTVHSVHLITYQELLSYVWNRIIKSEHSDELFKILEEQISDAECMCFTGRFNRTLSVLVGFYSDIKINISDKSRIAAIILNCKEKIVPYDDKIHQEMAKKELIEAGYSEEEIVDWIEAIIEIE